MALRLWNGRVATTSLWLLVVFGQSMHADSQTTAAEQEEALVQLAEGEEEQALVYLPPVDAEVVDFFRPPAHVGASGNRGLEYNPDPGQPVRASAQGEVLFAGSVARNRFVTVLHCDGLRTSYGYLGWIAVEEGDWVAPGHLLGTTSERFFFSVRAGDDYVDPALVLTAGRVRLIPNRVPDGRSRLPAYGSDH